MRDTVIPEAGCPRVLNRSALPGMRRCLGPVQAQVSPCHEEQSEEHSQGYHGPIAIGPGRTGGRASVTFYSLFHGQFSLAGMRFSIAHLVRRVSGRLASPGTVSAQTMEQARAKDCRCCRSAIVFENKTWRGEYAVTARQQESSWVAGQDGGSRNR